MINVVSAQMILRRSSLALVAAVVLFSIAKAVSAAGPADENAIRNAWALYTQQKYAASADAFEALIRTSAPSARLYYYAAAANKSGNRLARAKQLCQYVVTNFPKSQEATYAQKLFPDAAPTVAAAAGANDGLPDSLKGKKLDDLMQTEEGRAALRAALLQQKGVITTTPTSAAVTVGQSASKSTGKSSADSNAQPFSAETIAQDGAGGITQFMGLESSMAALAMLPRGQQLIATMIRSGGSQGTYIVRFPGGDGAEYTLTPEKVESCRIRDKAMWATLIHCAEIMRFHNNSSLNIDDALTCLTGKRAEKLYASNTTEEALIEFISKAIKKESPIVCEASDDFGTAPELVELGQDYTITAFDASTGMITMRDPHGGNSRRFRLETDKEHKKFEQLNDGMLRMHVSLFPKYFKEVASSAI